MDPQGLSSHSNERARSMRPWVAATVAELPPPLSLAMYPPYPQQNYQTSSTQGWGVTGDPGAPFMMMDGHYQAIQNPPQLHLDTVDSAFSTQIPSLGINMNGFGAGGLPLGRSQGLGLSREPSLTGFEQSPALSRGPSFPGSDRSFALSRGSSFTGVDSRLGFEGMNGAGHGNYLQILPHDQHSLQTYGESHAGSSSFNAMDDMLHIEQFKCRWEGCDYTDSFSRESCLLRHIRAKHTSPDKFKCKVCGRGFGRKDKYKEHRC